MCPPPVERKPFSKLVASSDDEEPTGVGNIDSALMRAQSRRDRAYFIVLAGQNLGQMFPISDAESVIGRASGSTIRLRDDGVSRRHARIVHDDEGQIVVEDLKSVNGILVNGHRVARSVLNDGDKIQVGSTTILKFTYADQLEEAFQQKMYENALRDGLTKTYSKRYFLERIPMEIAYARRYGTPLSLIMIDVDHFKRVNDTHGHPAGDYVLAALATGIARALRTEDLFARYGGEEFAILCRNTPLESAALLGERLRELIESAVVEYHGTRIPVTISVGVAAFAEQADAATKLIGAADAALYAAKGAGRNRLVKAAPDAAAP
jgi:two-component system cell cycle response regulator